MATGAASSFVASIDDAGDVLVLAGESFTVGHVSGGRDGADLRFLGDVEPLHARISLEETFHGGLGWVLECLPGAAPPEVDGTVLDDPHEPVALADGREVRLGRGASFRVRRKDDSSASIGLELDRGTEAAGARRVLLVAPGDAGRVRIGSRKRRHVPVAGLQYDVGIVVEIPLGDAEADAPGRVVVHCGGGVRRADAPPDGAVDVEVELPIERRIDLAVGAAPDRRPPFGIAFRPA